MSITFNVAEVFDIAIQLERNGATFYRKSSKHAPDESTKQDLLDLASMEEAHEITFRDLKNELLGAQAEADWFDPDGEASKYLQTFASGHVFDITFDMYEALPDDPSIKDILTFAIQRERDSVLFFSGMRDLVPSEQGADKIQDIIKQEMGHVVLISNRLDNL